MPLNKPFWLRLFRGPLGESHAADLLQHFADTHNNGHETFIQDHLVSSIGPEHIGVRWARAVACLDVSLIPIRKLTEPGASGDLLWQSGFKVPPHISKQPDAIKNGAEGWWLNWELNFEGSDNPRQDILIGYEMRNSAAGGPTIEGPTDAFRSRFFQDGRKGSFLLSVVQPAISDDDDPAIYSLIHDLRRIFLAVR